MAILSLPSSVISPQPHPSFSKPVLIMFTRFFTSSVLYFFQVPFSLAASMSANGCFSSWYSMQSNNLLGSVIIRRFGIIRSLAKTKVPKLFFYHEKNTTRLVYRGGLFIVEKLTVHFKAPPLVKSGKLL